MSVVAIAHTREKHRTLERVTGLAREVLYHLGGMSRFVQPGQTVLIKPNLTVYYSAEEGCTTEPPHRADFGRAEELGRRGESGVAALQSRRRRNGRPLHGHHDRRAACPYYRRCADRRRG